MKVLVTGVCGQLGHDIIRELVRRRHDAIGSDIAPEYGGILAEMSAAGITYVQLDITDEVAVKRVLAEVKPDAVIHCAAWTAVDAAEDCEDKVYAINVGGTEHIASVCYEIGARMMYISTDYVFSGQGEAPWQPDCKVFMPLSVYGKTKLEGERSVGRLLEKFFVVRVSWAFGVNGRNFIETMLELGKKSDNLRVVCDQIGTPTYTLDLARLLVDMIETDKYGYYHASNEGGYISWADFAKEIFRQAGMNTRVTPVTTAEYGLAKAVRPFNSRLDKSKLVEQGFAPLPDWRDALARYLAEKQENK